MLDVATRFWSKVAKTDGCWNWTASRNPLGYGTFRFRGHRVGAQRVAYELMFGSIPNGLWILHRCDNRRCVNPSHLYLGNHAQNMLDRKIRGRTPKWERNGKARLTVRDVQTIRGSFAQGSISKAELGRRFGVSANEIMLILRGDRWIGA